MIGPGNYGSFLGYACRKLVRARITYAFLDRDGGCVRSSALPCCRRADDFLFVIWCVESVLFLLIDPRGRFLIAFLKTDFLSIDVC